MVQSLAVDEHEAATQTDRLAAQVRAACEPLPELDHGRFGEYFDRYGHARVVLIGEATYGSAEFYRTRAAVTRRLIARHGFNIIAVEADSPDAAQVDCHVRLLPAPPQQASHHFPQWLWRNAEIEAFSYWMRGYNNHREPAKRVEFRGLDVYSLYASIAAALEYLDRIDPVAAAEARRRYGRLDPWREESSDNGREVLLGLASCEEAVLAQLRNTLDLRLDERQPDGETLFGAEQNARIEGAAEQYYRLMYRGAARSSSLRDAHMFETLQRVLQRRGADAKAVVWAHNSHVGYAPATSMGRGGEPNLGELCRRAWGDDAVLIGMGTDRGEVVAADDWDGDMRRMSVRASRAGSWEQVFLRAGRSFALTDFRNADTSLREALSASRLERAIGFIYRPESELLNHYFSTRLAEQFDAWIWIERTAGVTSLAPGHPAGATNPYPFGL